MPWAWVPQGIPLPPAIPAHRCLHPPSAAAAVTPDGQNELKELNHLLFLRLRFFQL